MSEASALWDLLRQTADPAAAEALKSAVASAPDRALNRINPLAFAAEQRSRRGGDDRGARPCRAARPVRHVVERALPGLRRRPGDRRGAEDRSTGTSTSARSAPKATSRRSTNWSRSPSPSIRASAASPRTIPTRCPTPNTCARSSGVRARSCRRTSRARSAASRSTRWSSAPGNGRPCRSSCRRASSSSSTRSPTPRCSSTYRGTKRQERRTLSLVFAESHAHSGTLKLAPGPVRITFENKAGRRTLPALWVHGDELARVLANPPAVPDRDAAPQQPDVPRPLSQRHVRSRAAVQDHQPHDPVHRSAGARRRSTTGSATSPPSIWCAAISAS